MDSNYNDNDNEKLAVFVSYLFFSGLFIGLVGSADYLSYDWERMCYIANGNMTTEDAIVYYSKIGYIGKNNIEIFNCNIAPEFILSFAYPIIILLLIGDAFAIIGIFDLFSSRVKNNEANRRI